MILILSTASKTTLYPIVWTRRTKLLSTSSNSHKDYTFVVSSTYMNSIHLLTSVTILETPISVTFSSNRPLRFLFELMNFGTIDTTLLWCKYVSSLTTSIVIDDLHFTNSFCKTNYVWLWFCWLLLPSCMNFITTTTEHL